MLATTNDGFYALNGSAGPTKEVITYYSVAWDAGSEANNERCPFIPGPPCGNFFARGPQEGLKAMCTSIQDSWHCRFSSSAARLAESSSKDHNSAVTLITVTSD